MTQAEYADDMVKEIEGLKRKYGKLAVLLSKFLNEEGIKNQQPANKKGIPVNFSFADGSELVVTYSVSRGKATGIVESTVEK